MVKIWINFEEKDIKKRKEGWREGEDFEDQIVYENDMNKNNDCHFEFYDNKVTLFFDNGWITMTKKEFGELFK